MMLRLWGYYAVQHGKYLQQKGRNQVSREKFCRPGATASLSLLSLRLFSLRPNARQARMTRLPRALGLTRFLLASRIFIPYGFQVAFLNSTLGIGLKKLL